MINQVIIVGYKVVLDRVGLDNNLQRTGIRVGKWAEEKKPKYNFETIAAIYLCNVVYDASYTCCAFLRFFPFSLSLSLSPFHNLLSLAK